MSLGIYNTSGCRLIAHTPLILTAAPSLPRGAAWAPAHISALTRPPPHVQPCLCFSGWCPQLRGRRLSDGYRLCFQDAVNSAPKCMAWYSFLLTCVPIQRIYLEVYCNGLMISERNQGSLFHFPEISNNSEKLRLKVLVLNKMNPYPLCSHWLPDNVLDVIHVQKLM